MVDYNGQAAFTYDALDRVAARNGTAFSYIGTMLDAVSDGTFTYGRSPGGRLISQTDGTTDLLVGLDRHGDLAWLADPATGVLTDTVMFDPFGDQTATTGSTDPTVGFQGDYTDPASEEVWMGARWYSGTDAVFRSRDTIFGELRTPISLNRYTYAWANPLTYFDPDGHSVIEGTGGVETYTYSGPRPHTSSGGTSPSGSWSDGLVDAVNDAVEQIAAQFGDTNPTPDAASQFAPTPQEVEVSLDSSQQEFITNFLDGHGALPSDWNEGTDHQQFRYFAWATLANGGGTSLSYDDFKALDTQQWLSLFDAGGADALDQIMKRDCAGAIAPWACEHKDGLTQSLLLVAGGALTVASFGGGSLLAGATGAELVGGGTAVSALGAGGYAMINQGINGGGAINPDAIRNQMLLGAAIGFLGSGAAAITQAATRATTAASSAATGGTGATVDFAHGTSVGSAQSIVGSGLDEAAGIGSSAGGVYSRPGSYHTFAVSPGDTSGLQLAYEMGMRHGDDVCVVVCRLPGAVYDDLVTQGQVIVESIPGVSAPQTVFSPGAFATINREAIWEIIKLGGV